MRKCRSETPDDRMSGPRRRPATGFSLIEVLVVLGILAFLIGVLLPVIGRARRASQETASLANIRQHAFNVETYCTDYKGVFPVFVDPKVGGGTVRWGADGEFEFDLYFYHVLFWNFGMAEYYGDNPYNDSMYSPVNRHLWAESVGFTPTYWYSSTLITDPDYWDLATRTGDGTGSAQWRAVRQAEMAEPSSKGVFVSGFGVHNFDHIGHMTIPSVEIAFGDGHAGRFARHETQPTRVRGSGDGQLITRQYPVLHTYEGVRGWDVR